MSYLVLARKYRPQTFKELIGQEHISELLGQAIQSNRIAQAYLFCGPRGTGKTSSARILAKSLNCVKGPTLTPCGECPACQEITKGNSFDVLEVDGASNRGIDEIRTLRENVKFAPSYGRYKIYIVDEVHMLTTEAFNALLKTLEEPPEHVKFIFATTAPNKVPSTILSRCQRFDFARIPVKTIVDALKNICDQEKLKVNEEALFAIAKVAQGGMRDALSILDQLSALSHRTIELQDVCSMLGLVELPLIFDLSAAVASKNAVAAFETLEKILSKGKDAKQLLKDLTEHYRNLMIIKIGGKSLGKLVDYPVNIKEQYLEQATQYSLPQILEAIDTFIEAQETARLTESLQMPLEIALAKLTTTQDIEARPKSFETKQPSAPAYSAPKSNYSKPTSSYTPTKILGNQKGEVDAPPKKIQDSIPEEPAAIDGDIKEGEFLVLDLEKIQKIWDTLTFAVSREKMSVASYLQEGTPNEFKDQTLTVAFSKEHSFHKEALEEKQNTILIDRIFSQKLKTQIYVRFKLIQETLEKQEDGVVKTALDMFKGKVVNRWHNE
jgi:DNA polymerase-3 subunit gamma/tau